MSGLTPLDIAHQQSHHDIVSLLQGAKAGFHDDDQMSLADSGYTSCVLSTDYSSIAEHDDIARMSDLEEEDDDKVKFDKLIRKN